MKHSAYSPLDATTSVEVDGCASSVRLGYLYRAKWSGVQLPFNLISDASWSSNVELQARGGFDACSQTRLRQAPCLVPSPVPSKRRIPQPSLCHWVRLSFNGRMRTSCAHVYAFGRLLIGYMIHSPGTDSSFQQGPLSAARLDLFG